MLICRNAEGVNGKKKVGNPCSSTIVGGWYSCAKTQANRILASTHWKPRC